MTATVTCHCPLCGKVSFIACDEDAYFQYVTTCTPIQEIFSNMDVHTRETLISGMCHSCQDNFFIEDDEDDCDGICDLCPLQDECAGSDIL